jgi:hypothetical protein
MPRASAPLRKASSSSGRARVKGTFMRERSAGATGFEKNDDASRQSYSSLALAMLRCSMPATPPCAISQRNTRPAT